MVKELCTMTMVMCILGSSQIKNFMGKEFIYSNQENDLKELSIWVLKQAKGTTIMKMGILT